MTSTLHQLSRRQASERSQEGVELDDEYVSSVPHTESMGEESQYSVMTEKGEGPDTVEEGSVHNVESFGKENLHPKYDEIAEKEGLGLALDRTNRTESSKSAEIAERRRKAAQAMILSENLVDDPMGVKSEYLFEDDGFHDEDDWNHQKIENASDPLPLDRLMEEDAEVFDDPFNTSSGDRDCNERWIESSSGIAQVSTVQNVVAPSFSSTLAAAPITTTAAPLTTSAADRRRQAALKMYNSSEMVPDNVDDFRLGTIDAVSPPPFKSGKNDVLLSSWMRAEPLNEVGRVTSFGSATSRARTDVTTSSVATARMGGSSRPSPRLGSSGKGSPSSKEFSFSDIAAASALVARTQTAAATPAAALSSPGVNLSSKTGGSSPTKAFESPAAQRRLQRAGERQLSIDGATGSMSGIKVGHSGTSMSESLKIPTPAMSPSAPPTARRTISTTTPKSAKIAHRRHNFDEFAEDPTLATIDSNDVSAMIDPIQNLASEDFIPESGIGGAAGSRASEETTRSTRNTSRFGKMTSRGRHRGQSAESPPTGYSQVQDEAPKKKITSIFGVAKLIRKASVSLLQMYTLCCV